MFSLGASDVGFRTTYKVTFEKILPPLPGPLAGPPLTVPLPTIVPISPLFFEADVKVVMDATEASNSFELTIYGLGDDVYGLLVPQKTVVHISLGYDDANAKEVMTGLMTEKSLVAGDQWYEATLKGVDFVFDRLQRPLKKVSKNYQGETVGAIAKDLCKQSGVDANIPDQGSTLPTQSFNDVTPFDALNTLARRSGFSLQAKDGKLWMGVPDKLGVTQTTPIDDGATSRPVVARGANAAASPLDGRDFDIAGLPSLRPNDLATLGSDTFRIQSVTHKLMRDGGYTCCGRALSPGASDDDAQKAGRPSASLVARQLKENLSQRDRKRPAVDVGEVNSYTPAKHTVTLDVGHDSTGDMPSPTVQATLKKDPVPLNDKPIASVFAMDGCGLIVPVYPKMRSVLVHGWHDPEDAVVGGFVWTTDMTPPKNLEGDWWLRVPMQVGDDGKASGKVIDDLITKDGQRVVQVKGMKITIGSGLLSPVGTRPSPGSDESLTIAADDGQTKITFEAGTIELTDGKVKLTIGGGKVSIG